jgi:Mg-chelatase subunit ChlD
MEQAQTVLIVVDTSASMADENKIVEARNGAIDFARSVNNRGVLTALAVFADRAAMVCDPTTGEQFARKVGKVNTGIVGMSTDLAAGLKLAAKCADSPEFGLRSVVVTDGQPNNKEEALNVADNLKRRNIQIVCVGTSDADQKFLQKLAGGKAIHVEPGNLRNAIAQSAAQLFLK